MSTIKNTTSSFDQQVEDYTTSELSRNEQLRKFMRSQKDTIVLGGYGERLAVRFKCLYVYGLEEEPVVLQPGVHGIKKMIYVLSIGTISQPALYWIQKEKIQLMVLDTYGTPMMISGVEKSNITLLTRQVTLSQSDKMDYSRYILKQKVQAQAETLRKHSSLLKQAEFKAQEITGNAKWFDVEYQDTKWLQTQQQLMQKEAQCANAYFEAWKQMPIKWTKSNASRVKALGFASYNNRHDANHASARNAHHPVNSLLNFAYGLAEQRIKLACVAKGLDVRFSFLHAQHEDRDNLVYDLVEPIRAHVDDLLLTYLEKNSLMLGDFSIEDTGVVKLTPHFAKVFAAYISKFLNDSTIHEVVSEYCNFLQAESVSLQEVA